MMTSDRNTLVKNVQNHIRSLNFGYRAALRNKNVEYINALAQFKDQNTLTLTDVKNKTREITSER